MWYTFSFSRAPETALAALPPAADDSIVQLHRQPTPNGWSYVHPSVIGRRTWRPPYRLERRTRSRLTKSRSRPGTLTCFIVTAGMRARGLRQVRVAHRCRFCFFSQLFCIPSESLPIFPSPCPGADLSRSRPRLDHSSLAIKPLSIRQFK